MEPMEVVNTLRAYRALRENIINATYPPNFSSDYTFYSKSPHFNCYAYAMQFRELGFDYEPGFVTTVVPERYNIDSLVRAFYEDCKALLLSYNPCSIDEPNNKDEYKVGIMIEKYGHHSSNRDFHFIRENVDGSWSEKAGYLGFVRTVENIKGHSKYDLVEVVKIKRPKSLIIKK